VCPARLAPGLVRDLGEHLPALRQAVGPHAEHLAWELLKAPAHPTPLTRREYGTKRGGWLTMQPQLLP
jgi:hypothetical protein